MSTLPLLLVAMVALTRAAVLPDAEAGKEMEAEVGKAEKPAETGGEVDVFKRAYSCPSGWSQYGQRCFRFVPRHMIWDDALRNCISMGASLASVHNSGEYHWIQKMIAEHTHAQPEAWLGGTDLGHEGHWRWSDGTPFWFSYWCRGEPNNHGYQHCMQMNFSEHKCWDDLACHHHIASVCVKKI